MHIRRTSALHLAGRQRDFSQPPHQSRVLRTYSFRRSPGMPNDHGHDDDARMPRQKLYEDMHSSSSMRHSSYGGFGGFSGSGFASGYASHETGSPGHSHDKDHPGEIGHIGLFAAAIIPPLVVFLAVLGLCFFLSRRRRTQRRYSNAARAPLSAMEMASTRNNETREYRRSPSPAPPVSFNNLSPAPVIVSDRNNAYLTGLDTSSQGSRPQSYGDFDDISIRRSVGGTFAEPPPPYKASGHGDDPPPVAYEHEVAPLGESTDPTTSLHRARSPFADPYDDEDVPIVADGLQYRRNPFDDPESPVSDSASRLRFARRHSGESDLR